MDQWLLSPLAIKIQYQIYFELYCEIVHIQYISVVHGNGRCDSSIITEMMMMSSPTTIDTYIY